MDTFRKFLEGFHGTWSPADEVAKGLRLTSPHKQPSHDVDSALAYIQYHRLQRELDALPEDISAAPRMKEIIRAQKALLKSNPNLTKVNPDYREVDTAGIYTDKTLDGNKSRWGEQPKHKFSRWHVKGKADRTLDVSTEEGWETLLRAKQQAVKNTDLPYKDALRQILIGLGYDSVFGGGFRGSEKEELVYLHQHPADRVE